MTFRQAIAWGYCGVERTDCTHSGGMVIMCDLHAGHAGPHKDRTHDYVIEWSNDQ